MAQVEGNCRLDLESPCSTCAPVACRRFDSVGDYLPVELQEDCNTKYGAYYDADCPSGDDDDGSGLTPQYDWYTDPGFVLAYCWLGGVTWLIFAWCCWNQRLSPVGDTEPLCSTASEADSTSHTPADDDGEEKFTQTAYREEWGGAVVYALTVATQWFIQIMLLVLTVFYYANQGDTAFDPVFVSEKEVLFAFELVWMVGLVWSLALKWPLSVRCLLLRRCTFAEASHVCVFTPAKAVEAVVGYKAKASSGSVSYAAAFTDFLSKATITINTAVAFLFSDLSCQNGPGTATYCKVETDSLGNRFFYFKLRRYLFHGDSSVNLNGTLLLKATSPKFYSETIHVGSRIANLHSRSAGLSEAEAEEARAIVGENAVHLNEPTLFRCVVREFSKPFYVYQTFMMVCMYFILTGVYFILSFLPVYISFFSYRYIFLSFFLTGIYFFLSFLPVYISFFLTGIYFFLSFLLITCGNTNKWSWFNFYFWHMAIIQTFVRIVGGLTVALVTYRNEANLFRLGNVSGSVHVLRQG
jgi:hypothetical protein